MSIDHLRTTRRRRMAMLGLLSLLVFAAGAVVAYAKGGTAKPPTKGVVAPNPVPTLPDPAFSVAPALIHGFDETGFIQDATVSADNSACPDVANSKFWGGSLTINNTKITVPCNLVVQMPANTLTWADMVNAPGAPSLTLKGSGYPSFEMRAVGNIVDGKHIAGLMFASQQSTNTGSGIIKKVDYSTGNLEVDTGAGGTSVVIQINDPSGRFGRKQSPDPRFSVDDQNPTIHAGTGYPMCVPRTDPATADDNLCPKANRPKPAGAGRHCRNFTDAGVVPLPASGDLTQPPAGQAYCSMFVMKSVTDPTRTATDPDPRQQAPFEVGDHITWAGTLIKSGTGDLISAHTVEANVGIYTQPNTQPSYLAIGEFGVGSADPNATAVSGVAQETQDRIFLESETTDVKTPVDIYMQDVDAATGALHNRWVTPFEMTGENQAGSPSGGITTQFAGAQPQRARLRATKAPLGLLSQPTRTIRVAVRSLCPPDANQATMDACLNNAPTTANGLVAGEYTAPTFEFIFPENVMPGDGVVPNDLWHLPFLRNGEGPGNAGPLEPAPW
jgi:hypothetical protein